jgi:hypothetical protein
MRTEPIPQALKRSAGIPDVLRETANDHVLRQQRQENRIYCGRCRYAVTTAEQIIAVNGAHEHLFRNPAGIVYRIGCFSTAEGCCLSGTPTHEFTWFAGYAWSVALCANCLLHLGWHYSSEASGFFGLILDHLTRQTRLH